MPPKYLPVYYWQEELTVIISLLQKHIPELLPSHHTKINETTVVNSPSSDQFILCLANNVYDDILVI